MLSDATFGFVGVHVEEVFPSSQIGLRKISVWIVKFFDVSCHKLKL
jgi:hypothetical protein